MAKTAAASHESSDPGNDDTEGLPSARSGMERTFQKKLQGILAPLSPGEKNKHLEEMKQKLATQVEKTKQAYTGSIDTKIENWMYDKTYGDMSRTYVVVLLTWGLISHLCTSLVLVASWIYTLSLMPTPHLPKGWYWWWMPFNESAVQNAALFRTSTSLRMFFGPLFLLIEGIGTVALYSYYQQFVDWLGQKCMTGPQRESYPYLPYLLALGCNIVGTGLLTAGGCLLGVMVLRNIN